MGRPTPYTDEQIDRFRRAVATGRPLTHLSAELGVSTATLRKYGDTGDSSKPRPVFDLPPSHLKHSERILDYAPACSAALGAWLDTLPDQQLSAVWKAIVVEQWGECNRADALSILRAVDERFVKVTTHGRATASPRSNADPNRAA